MIFAQLAGDERIGGRGLDRIGQQPPGNRLGPGNGGVALRFGIYGILLQRIIRGRTAEVTDQRVFGRVERDQHRLALGIVFDKLGYPLGLGVGELSQGIGGEHLAVGSVFRGRFARHGRGLRWLAYHYT